MADPSQDATIASWVRQHGTLARFDLEIALCHILDCSRAHLLTHPDRALNQPELAQLERWSDQLYKHVPIAYLCGNQEFWGLSLTVDHRVLVPRPDTETLVEQTLACMAQQDPSPSTGTALRLLDLGTGSGAIALALASERPDADVHACDCSLDSLAVARENSRSLRLPVTLHHSDWFDNISQRYDLIVSNPPYIAPSDPHLDLLGAEPAHALVADDNGLADLRTICEQAGRFLQTNGWLLLEHGFDQAEAVRSLLSNNGFIDVQSRRDLGGNERVTWGQKPSDQALSAHE
jgi:release factor glutamine methyltransferase